MKKKQLEKKLQSGQTMNHDCCLIALGLGKGIESGSHIKFVPWVPKKKTKTWLVETKDDTPLGIIHWYGAWRCYGFSPKPATVFEKVCLREIADFCERKTQEHKKGDPK